MTQSSNSQTIGHAMARRQALDIEQAASEGEKHSRSTAAAAGSTPPNLFGLETFIKRSLLSRITIALTVAAVTATVLISVDALSRPASGSAERQITKPATNSNLNAAKTRRMSQIEVSGLVAHKA